MDDIHPNWLPKLILLSEYNGRWDEYVEVVYDHFYNDFIRNRTYFLKMQIYTRYHPSHDGKGATFWHVISEGEKETDRIPDIRRCERIRWPKPIIEKDNIADVKIWESFRIWRKQKQKRIHFAINSFSYIVVIAKSKKGFDFVTTFHIEKKHRREKMKKQFEAFLTQKKRGLRLLNGP